MKYGERVQAPLSHVPPLALGSRLPQVSPLAASLAAPAPRCRRKKGHGRVSRGSAEAGKGACVLQQSSAGQPLGVLPLARVPWVLKAAGEMRIGGPFDFSTPSPDDAIQSALKGGHVAPRAAATSAAVPASAAATAAAKSANSSGNSRASSSASLAADVAAAGVGKIQITEGRKKEASPSAGFSTTATAATATAAAAGVGEGGGEGKGGEDEETRRRKALEAYEAEGWIKEGLEGGDGKANLHLIV
ncbi:unnamed protein product, partial [Closterium sp. NIES-53]